MKKIAVTILSVLYVVTSSGATINFHYCMGKFIGWDLSAPANNTCRNCGMAKNENKGCCNDAQQTLQLKKDQVATVINLIPQTSFHYLNTRYFFTTKTYLPAIVCKPCSLHGPPGLNNESAFILNCVFRI